jgi:hypothetical protein
MRRLVLFFGALIAVGLWASAGWGHAPPTVTSGLTATPPTIDGVLSPGEWASAATFPFTVSNFGGTAYVMNDGANLYIAATIADPTCCGLNSLGLFFDNTHDGVLMAGDDALVANLGSSFGDDYYNGTCCFLSDSGAGGTNDVIAFGRVANGVATFEVQHPLCSADTAHDFCVATGSTMGFDIYYQPANGIDGGFPTSVFTDQSAFGDLIIAPVSPGDTTPPSTTLGFPYAAGFNEALWRSSGCPTVGFCGTASDPDSAVQTVRYSVQRLSTGRYWNGSSFDSLLPVWLTANGTNQWSVTFPFFNFPRQSGSYRLQLESIDPAGNVETPHGVTFVINR